MWHNGEKVSLGHSARRLSSFEAVLVMPWTSAPRSDKAFARQRPMPANKGEVGFGIPNQFYLNFAPLRCSVESANQGIVWTNSRRKRGHLVLANGKFLRLYCRFVIHKYQQNSISLLSAAANFNFKIDYM